MSDSGVDLSTAYAARPRLGTEPQALTRSTRTAGTGSPQIIVKGIDPVDGLIFGLDTTNNQLKISADAGTTWSNSKGIPASTSAANVAKVVRFGNYVWLLTKDDTGGTGAVYRAAPASGNTAYTWSGVLKAMVSGGTQGVGTIFNAGQSALLLGEYGDPSGGPSIYRISLADANGAGTNWTRVYGPDSTIRHIHCVAEDTYNPGTWWGTFGDGTGAKCVQISTDDGQTWAAIGPSGGGWQAVQISFSPRYVWFANDNNTGSVWVMDRTARVPMWATEQWHHGIAVPGELGRKGGLTFSDGVLNGTTTLTSATAGFSASDVGRFVSASGIYLNTYIASYVNATTVTLSQAAAISASNVVVQMTGDRFYSNAYFGAVDPATERFYFATATGSVYGNTHALFCLPGIARSINVLDVPPPGAGGNAEVFVFGGKVYWERYVRPLIGAVAQP